jgi:hypothetical protein
MKECIMAKNEYNTAFRVIGKYMFFLVSLLQFVTCSPNNEVNSFTATINISDEIPTVIQVDIESELQMDFWVEVKTETNLWQTITKKKDEIPNFTILGLPENEELQVLVTGKDEFGTTHQQEYEVQTGQLKYGASQVLFSPTSFQELEGYFLGTLFSDPAFLLLFDTNGNILWGIEHGDEEHGGIDSEISSDGTSIFYNIFLKDKSEDDGHIIEIDWMGNILNEIRTPLAHHIFTLLPDNSLSYISLDIRETVDFGPVCGDKIVKRFPNGTEETIHSTWDSIPLYETSSWNFALYPFCRDWTHGNFLEYNEERESYLFSTAGPDIIMELSPSGEVLQRFAGQDAQEEPWILSDEDSFSYPHGIHWGRDGQLMMISTIDEHSAAVSYTVNNDTMNLSREWTYGEEYEHHSLHLGEVIDYGTDVRMVNWGSVGHLQLLDTEDQILWELYTDLGQWFAQIEYLSTLPGMKHVATPL